jgi:hypothetical protein
MIPREVEGKQLNASTIECYEMSQRAVSIWQARAALISQSAGSRTSCIGRTRRNGDLNRADVDVQTTVAEADVRRWDRLVGLATIPSWN